jgi:transcriptional regulator with XRE-family HTH domain
MLDLDDRGKTEKNMIKTTPYGALLRERRVRAGLSLRDVADHLGCSHVSFANIERGVSGPLKPEREKKLLEILPTVTAAELQLAREASKPFKLTSSNTPPKYFDLTMAFARRIEHENLSDTGVRKIMQILDDEDDD